MQKNIRVGLPFKFIFVISLIVLITSATLTFYFIQTQERQLQNALEDRCRFLAQNLATNSEFGVLTDDRQFLNSLMSTMSSDKDLLYALIFNARGRALAWTTTGMFWKNDFQGKPISPIPVAVMATAESGKQFFEVTVPIVAQQMVGIREEIGFMADTPAQAREEIIGAARVALSLDSMHRESNRLKTTIVALTAGVVLGAIILGALLIRIIIRPIRQLMLGTKKIAAGDLDAAVAVNAEDEIGELAKSFNQMAQDIKTYVSELSSEKENLLQLKLALEQRTNELEHTLIKMQEIQGELLRSEKFAMIGKLASSVAHDLRNPLASLKNISYYLRRSIVCQDEKSIHMFEMLSADVTRANKIVTDLLDYSRVKRLHKVSMNANEFFARLTDSVQFTHKNLTIVRAIEPFDIYLDPDRMTQVLINLINNAADAMDENGVITITAARGDTMFVIRIADTGHGMDANTAAHIFEPLFTTKTKGLGLGLSIVKEIVDAHAGEITVTSEPGTGTTFTITLPLPPDTATGEDQAHEQTAAENFHR